MSIKSPFAPGILTTALVSVRTPFSPGSDSPWPSSAAASRSLSIAGQLLSPATAYAGKHATLTAPSPIAPSPINSETTEFADVDDVDDHESSPDSHEAQKNQYRPMSIKDSPLKVDTGNTIFTTNPIQSEDDDEPPASVIYAPAGFAEFHSSPESSVPKTQSYTNKLQPRIGERVESSDSIASDITVTKATGPRKMDEKFYNSQVPPTPLQTSIPSAPDWVRTPRAQTRQDFGVLSRPGSSLAIINEGDDYMADMSNAGDDDQSPEQATSFYRNADDDVQVLNQALTECWTLCNTLSDLSNARRERIFNFSGNSNTQQQTWKSCWRLCQNLYDARDIVTSTNVRTTLECCREFCQALFDVRVRDDETADSVLRVSFELNNHLFNTHDQHLPEVFRERTLDFYTTLCHRLMKQKVEIAEEADNLLKACWSLAEILFSIRQSRKDGRQPDEELLGSAIQACWDLCDLFREGWSSVRPDSRQTPRPSQATFTQAFQQARNAGVTTVGEAGDPKPHPGTPTTMIDESTTDSPCEAPVPNIVVLRSSNAVSQPHSAVTVSTPSVVVGTTSRQTTYRWPVSNVHTSKLTQASPPRPDPQPSYTHSSAGPTEYVEDQTLILLKSLFVRAAVLVNRGFIPTSSHPKSQPAHLTSLPLFAKSLPETAFGTQAWQMNLLDNYRRTIYNDTAFQILGAATDTRLILPAAADPNTSVRLRKEIAGAVRGMVAGTSGWSWLKDLFRFAFNVYIEEVLRESSSNSTTHGGHVSSHGQPRLQISTQSSKTSNSNSSSSRSSSSNNESAQLRPSKERQHLYTQDEKLLRSNSGLLLHSVSRDSRRGSTSSVTSNSGEKRLVPLSKQNS